MAKVKRYWPPAHHVGMGAAMDLRCAFAWDLLQHFGIVAGVSKREDASGRAVLDVMPVEETVARCFALADLFVATAEERGGLRESTDADAEAAFKRAGELQAIRDTTAATMGRVWRRVRRESQPPEE